MNVFEIVILFCVCLIIRCMELLQPQLRERLFDAKAEPNRLLLAVANGCSILRPGNTCGVQDRTTTLDRKLTLKQVKTSLHHGMDANSVLYKSTPAYLYTDIHTAAPLEAHTRTFVSRLILAYLFCFPFSLFFHTLSYKLQFRTYIYI